MENKKYDDKRVERKIPLFYLVGLNVALFLSIVAFEFKTYEGDIIDLNNLAENSEWMDEPVVLPPEAPKPKPTPPKPEPIIKEVLEEPEDIPDITIDNEAPDEGIPDIILGDLPPAPVVEAPFIIVEEMPSFPGGYDALYKFVSKKLKYPSQDRRMGLEGKVYVKFVVEKDGTLGDIHVIKGISSSMDAETLRVMNIIPKFNPGKQRGKPVRVWMTIPINFRLSK